MCEDSRSPKIHWETACELGFRGSRCSHHAAACRPSCPTGLSIHLLTLKFLSPSAMPGVSASLCVPHCLSHARSSLGGYPMCEGYPVLLCVGLR